MQNIKLSELKAKSPAELLAFAEESEVENASTMRKQELMFAILKELAAQDINIVGEGVARLMRIICPVRTIFMLVRARFAGLVCVLAIRSRAKFVLPRKANATLRC
jgi:hypothetical protein